MNARSLVEGLNGRPFVRASEKWSGSFDGTIGIDNVEERGDTIRFDLTVPTGASDIDDYIWRTEREKGATEKVLLRQGGSEITGSRIVGIVRQGTDPRWESAGPDQYRLTFEVPGASFREDAPLEVQFGWPRRSDADWTIIGSATGLSA